MAKTTRRGFLVGCSSAIATMAGARLSFAAFAGPQDVAESDVLVTVFLRGGSDALNLVPPIAGDDRGYYEDARPDLQVPASGPDAALPLNGQLGLHPSAAGLYDVFQDGRLAVVHAAGMHEDTRSHFDAMAYMELGTPGSSKAGTGWMTRHLQTSPDLPDEILMPAIAAGSSQPASLLGSYDAVTMSSTGSFNLESGPYGWRDAQRQALRSLYGTGASPLHLAGAQALDAVDIIEAHNVGSYQPGNGAVYPSGSFGDRLKLIAQMIKLPVGLRAAAIDLGGWDSHRNQGDGATGYFAGLVNNLSEGLTALYSDLNGSGTLNYAARVTIVVMSEFGRRLRANADDGTDHGHGGVILVLGGSVNGGVYGPWPGLQNDQLYDGSDLAVTTDYRQVLAEILLVRLQNPFLNVVFPAYLGYQRLGIVEGTEVQPAEANTVFVPSLSR